MNSFHSGDSGSPRPTHQRSQLSRRRLLRLCTLVPAGIVLPSCSDHRRLFSLQPDWEYDFSQRPDGPIDFTVWKAALGPKIPDYNSEVATYTDRTANVRVEGRALIIEARREWMDGKPYTSAYLTTEHNAAFMFGRIDVVLKMPHGAGTWPAAWLLPAAPRYRASELGLSDTGSSWPLNGEIDIVEAIGARPNIAYGNAHSYNSNKNKGISDNAVGTTVDNLSTAFNTYSIEWLPDSISFLVNGSPYHKIRQQSDSPADWPFCQEYYLIINLAMGGSWGGEKYNEYPPDGVDPRYNSWTLAVQSIRYYRMLDQPTDS